MILAGGKCGGALQLGRVDLMRKALEAWQRENLQLLLPKCSQMR